MSNPLDNLNKALNNIPKDGKWHTVSAVLSKGEPDLIYIDGDKKTL